LSCRNYPGRIVYLEPSWTSVLCATDAAAALTKLDCFFGCRGFRSGG
jgi:hypothetical protein